MSNVIGAITAQIVFRSRLVFPSGEHLATHRSSGITKTIWHHGDHRPGRRATVHFFISPAGLFIVMSIIFIATAR